MNYLDENCDITDPPTAFTPRAESSSFCQPACRANSPLQNAQSNMFCDRCLTNQHLFVQCLANYLPEEDDPRYEDFLAKEPEYRRNLEKRYPQVCPDCVDKVQAEIKGRNYAVKAELLGKKLNKSRDVTLADEECSNLVRWAVRTGGIMWWLSLLLQILWHAFRAKVSAYDDGFDLDEKMDLVYFKNCALEGWKTGLVPRWCLAQTNMLMVVVLAMGFSSIWWHPQMQFMLRPVPRIARSCGKAGFYGSQCFLLAARIGAWEFFANPARMGLSPVLFRAFHLFMIIFLALATSSLLSQVTIDTTPRISLRETSIPLIPDDSPECREQFRKAKAANSFTPRASFPIHKLAPRSYAPQFTPATLPPSPPLSATTVNDYDDNDNDIMEWTPTKFSGPMAPLSEREVPLRELAPPRFIWSGPGSKAQEVGIEDLFARSFKIADEPTEVPSGPSAQPERSSMMMGWTALVLLLLGASAVGVALQVPNAYDVFAWIRGGLGVAV
ncbi:hypothetical protein LTR66_001903 [Elasticomyces elasticus]|nr:hypothetical protein LTR66_001903 [Elasticomyces elasticus]